MSDLVIVSKGEIKDKLKWLYHNNKITGEGTIRILKVLDKATPVSGEAIAEICSDNGILDIKWLDIDKATSLLNKTKLYTTPQPVRIAELESALKELLNNSVPRNAQFSYAYENAYILLKVLDKLKG